MFLLSYEVFVSLQESFGLFFHKYCLVYNFEAIVIIYYTYVLYLYILIKYKTSFCTSFKNRFLCTNFLLLLHKSCIYSSKRNIKILKLINELKFIL